MRNNGILMGSLPIGGMLELNYVRCPKCGNEFHRVGHHHSFKSKEAIYELLGTEFELIKTGVIPNFIFSIKPLNFITSILIKYFKKMINNRFANNLIQTYFFVAKSHKP